MFTKIIFIIGFANSFITTVLKPNFKYYLQKKNNK